MSSSSLSRHTAPSKPDLDLGAFRTRSLQSIQQRVTPRSAGVPPNSSGLFASPILRESSQALGPNLRELYAAEWEKALGARPGLETGLLRDILWEVMRFCVALEVVDGATDSHSLWETLSVRFGRVRVGKKEMVTKMRLQLLQPMLKSVDMATEAQSGVAGEIEAMVRSFQVWERTKKNWRGNLRTRYIIWQLLRSMKLAYVKSSQEALWNERGQDPGVLEKLREAAGCAYQVISPPRKIGFLSFFSFSFAIAFSLFFAVPSGLHIYEVDQMKPEAKLLIGTIVACIGGGIAISTVVTVSRFLRFERLGLWWGGKPARKAIMSDYNLGRQRIQHGLRHLQTNEGFEMMRLPPVKIRDATLKVIQKLRHTAFAISSLAIGVLVIEFRPLGDIAFELSKPRAPEPIVLVAQVYACLLLLTFILTGCVGVMLDQCVKLIPEGEAEGNPRVTAAIAVYEDVESYIQISRAAIGMGLVAFATCAHIIAVISFRVDTLSTGIILGLIILLFYGLSSNVAYVNSDLVLDGVDFDEGPICRKGLEFEEDQEKLLKEISSTTEEA